MIHDPNIHWSAFRKHPVMVMWWIFHRVTRAWRGLPSFIIVGVQKGGTTSLFEYLSHHPGILPPFRKEIKYFDFNYAFGKGWYQANFPLRRKMNLNNAITGEASPNYIFHPNGLERIAQILPGIKVIAILRNPVTRAYSHYQHMLEQGREDLPFETAIEAEEERLQGEAEKIAADSRHPQDEYFNHSYLARGRYIEQVPKLFEIFPKENILILKSEDLYARTAEIYHETLAFLNLSAVNLPKYEAANQGKYEPMNENTQKKLADYFAPFNAELYRYLKRDFGWE
jgi:hypothetical protein